MVSQLRNWRPHLRSAHAHCSEAFRARGMSRPRLRSVPAVRSKAFRAGGRAYGFHPSSFGRMVFAITASIH